MKILYTILLLLAITITSAQEHVSLSIHQDTRLAFLGDDKGNDAGTINLLARFKMQGNQQTYGYLIIYPELEYAEIAGTYYRYSVNVGYTFNQLIIPNIEASAALSYGFIDRYSKSLSSWSASGELAYNFNYFKISLIAQFTERKDLLWLYGKNEIRFSGFFGVEFNLN